MYRMRGRNTHTYTQIQIQCLRYSYKYSCECDIFHCCPAGRGSWRTARIVNWFSKPEQGKARQEGRREQRRLVAIKSYLNARAGVGGARYTEGVACGSAKNKGKWRRPRRVQATKKSKRGGSSADTRLMTLATLAAAGQQREERERERGKQGWVMLLPRHVAGRLAYISMTSVTDTRCVCVCVCVGPTLAAPHRGRHLFLMLFIFRHAAWQVYPAARIINTVPARIHISLKSQNFLCNCSCKWLKQKVGQVGKFLSCSPQAGRQAARPVACGKTLRKQKLNLAKFQLEIMSFFKPVLRAFPTLFSPPKKEENIPILSLVTRATRV